MNINLATKHRSGIFRIYGPTKSILIGTSNIINYLLQLTDGMNTGNRRIDPEFKKDFNNELLKIELLEDCSFSDQLRLNIRLNYYLQQYAQLYSHQKFAGKYSIKLMIKKHGLRFLTDVVLVPAGNLSRVKTIGIFDDIDDAKQWIDKVYPNGYVNDFIIADNELTKIYLKN